MRFPLRLAVCAALALVPSISSAAHEDPVGLSLLLENGASPGIDVIQGNTGRFIDELDILTVAQTATDEGIDPIIESGDFADLNWNGVELVDEEWRPDGTGTFTRQRFYRGARWMSEPSAFLIVQVDNKGKLLPVLPHLVYAGSDDLWSGLDGAFIRRFNARQVTFGCAAIDDCSGSTQHVAQGLVQLRQSQYPLLDTRKIHKKTAALVVYWSADPFNLREIPVSQIKPKDAEYGHGFEIEIQAQTPPANGMYYMPGESITFEVIFRDGNGKRLDDNGSLPTYAEFIGGGTESGLRYFDALLNPTLYYALKHREGNMTLTMGGPSDGFAVTDYTVPFLHFFQEQIQLAFADEHGFSAVSSGVPPFPVILGGLVDPTIWTTPLTNQVTLTVPEDALPGTYVVTLKGRRDYGGEATNAGAVLRIQVGTTEQTSWEPTTGNCETCHSGPTALRNILHGIGDRESCLAGCHTSIEMEPDSALDYRVHFVHSRSNRYPADINNCSVCHFEEPDGIPRGYPGFVFPFD